jgi:class 3 adenylate cyclase/Tfp pilus assembly protein PilF
MKKWLLFFGFIFLGLSLSAQNQDSLYQVWQSPQQADSNRLQAFKDYIWNGYLFSKTDSALTLSEEMRLFGEKQEYPMAVNQAYTLKAIAYDLQGDFTTAMDFAQKAVAANTEINNLAGISEAEIVVGVLYEEQGLFSRALEHYQKALVIDEKINNKAGMAMSLNNIGNIYDHQNNKEQALKYYQRALAIDQDLGVKQGVAVELANIGIIYQGKGQLREALKYLQQSLQINIEIGDKAGEGGSYSSIANVYQELEKPDSALAFYQKSLAIFKKLGAEQYIASGQTQLGFYYLTVGQEELAIQYCLKALNQAIEIAATEKENNACLCLYQGYKKIGEPQKALAYYEQAMQLKDQIYNKDNTRKITQLQMQYEFDKREAAIKAEQEKKDALAQEELERQKLVRNSFIGGFAVVLLFAGVFLVQRNRIGKEKERSEELLLNILPEETAQELKEKGQADAQLIDQVTVLFTDFKGFTAMSEKLSPKALVKDLHECFSLFDAICEKYGVEKIKTIGDAYMAAGGLPTPNQTHAEDMVNAALEMAQVVEAGVAKKKAANLPFFQVRIGVHTGPVVAGIVGVKKFQYDIWGDTVNTASRMESSGEVGQVNISQSTFALLKDNPQFTFKSRGKIEAKGKGMLEMFFANRA